MIKVLIAEDSAVVRCYLSHLLSQDPGIQVVGEARDGLEAIDLVRSCNPDVVTMDVQMPRMDGLEATRRIMENLPRPVLIVSASFQPEDLEKSFLALEAGAVAVAEKPLGPGHPDAEKSGRELVQSVKLMSEVKVVRRWPRRVRPADPAPVAAQAEAPRAPLQLLAVGASTGGPMAVKALLTGLPARFAVPILLVQHISAGFVRGFTEWLSSGTGRPVHVASAGEYALPGRVYVAPDGAHMGVTSSGRIILEPRGPDDLHCPSVGRLFKSAAAACGSRAAAVLLTGMGEDGAADLKLLRDAGAVTFAQDASSSAVFGMPGEAVRIGAAVHVMAPEEMGAVLARLAGGRDLAAAG